MHILYLGRIHEVFPEKKRAKFRLADRQKFWRRLEVRMENFGVKEDDWERISKAISGRCRARTISLVKMISGGSTRRQGDSRKLGRAGVA